MNQNLCRGLTAAVLVSAFGLALPANAEQNASLATALATSKNQLEASATESVEGQATPEDSNHLEVDTPAPADSAARPASPIEDLALGLSDLVQIVPHALHEKQAATLFVNDIPVLTFLGQPVSPESDKENQAAAAESPVARAAEVAQQIDQFHLEAGDPTAISVRWDAALEEYTIALAEDALVFVNAQNILPDTTGNPAEDALQATNRLRRLMGGAAPLSEIEGAPAPEIEVAARVDWDVTSVFTGSASWYGPGFHGRRTASGEVFNQNALTAAHRTLPFGTRVRVTNLRNNRQVVVRINDRGPFSHGRVLDLSAGAAREIGLDRAGVGPVRIEVLSN